jgi:asparagine synthase (glutamine-hydrolysing)
MCGILAVVSNSLNRESFQNSLNLLNHRGPDHTASKFFKDVGLGHTRLSILDLSTRGHQPMHDGSKRVFVTYNGEIYNYRNLTIILKKRGHNFLSGTDTEVLINGYLEWGISGLLKRIEGMFAFCLYDKKKRRLYAVRDRFGMKPIYYSINDQSIVISSEMKSILALRDVPKLDDLYMYSSLFYLRSRVGKRTPFKGISEIMPGCYLELDGEKKTVVATKTYFEPLKSIKKKTYEANKRRSIGNKVTELKKIMEESIERHLVSDAEIGILYSGGLDSSIISALAGKIKPGLNLFHSEADNFKESTKYAKMLTEKFDYKLLLCKQTKDYLSYLPHHIYHFETVCTRSDVAYSFLCKKAADQGVKVLLSGDAADEVFGGYDIYHMVNDFSKTRKSIEPSIETLLISGHSDFQKMCMPLDLLFFGGMRRERWEECLDNYSFVSKRNERNCLAYMLENLTGNLVTKFLHRGDRAGMMHSVEVRVPFLYRPLVDFALNLPLRDKLRKKDKSWRNKFILRELATLLGIPDKIINRPKIGLATSFESSLASLRPLFKNSVLRDYWHLEDKIFQRYLDADQFYFWTFLNYEIFMRIFFNGDDPDDISKEIRGCLADIK